MHCEFITTDTELPPCAPFPKALARYPVNSTAKVMYALMLGAALAMGTEDENGILFIQLPTAKLAAAVSRSNMTAKRSLKELEDAGLVMRAKGKPRTPNRLYILVPKKEGSPHE